MRHAQVPFKLISYGRHYRDYVVSTVAKELMGPVCHLRYGYCRTARIIASAYDRNVDLATVVTPGAQSLVTAILTDTWAQARTVIARIWARRQTGDDAGDLGDGALERVSRELDNAMQQAVALAGDGLEAERAERMELFMAGFLVGQLSARPELVDAIREMPSLVGINGSSSPTTMKAGKTIRGSTVQGNVVQADDISGGIRFS